MSEEKDIHSLVIDEKDFLDQLCIGIDQNKIDELGFFRGEIVTIKNKQGKSTLSSVFPSESCEFQKVQLNKNVRQVLGVNPGDEVSLSIFNDYVQCEKITVLPYADTINEVTGDLKQDYLKPFFDQSCYHICKGDSFTFKNVEFKCVSCEPKDYGFVSRKTEIITEGDPIIRQTNTKSVSNLSNINTHNCSFQLSSQCENSIEEPQIKPKLVNVFYHNSQQRLKIFDGTPEDNLIMAVKRCMHINSDPSHIFLHDEEGDILVFPKIIPNGLKIYIFIDNEISYPPSPPSSASLPSPALPPPPVSPASPPLSKESTTNITIRTLRGRNMQFQVPQNILIKDIKEKIFIQEGIPVDDQRLIYSAIVLDDNKSLQDYSIKEGTYLVLLNKAR